MLTRVGEGGQWVQLAVERSLLDAGPVGKAGGLHSRCTCYSACGTVTVCSGISGGPMATAGHWSLTAGAMGTWCNVPCIVVM